MPTGFSHESPVAASVEWYTPRWIFDALGLTFDLDVAAPAGGVPWVPAAAHYTKEDNALIKPWRGRVWCNPPYGNLTSPFLARMHEHRNGVALVFSRTDTGWFQNYAANADAVLFFNRRINFIPDAPQAKKSGPGAGSVLLAWHSDCVTAVRSMAPAHGRVWFPSFDDKEAA